MSIAGCRFPILLAVVTFVVLPGCHRAKPLALRKVVLYQNGIGYFERTGTFRGQRLRLHLRRHELNDVLKTLTVIDRSKGKKGRSPVAAIVPKQPAPESATDGENKQQPTKDRPVFLDIALGHGGVHDLLIAYSAPTPAWKATYRLVLPDQGDSRALLQGWALINNASGEDWGGVKLTLATGSPMTFAIDMHSPHFVARPDLGGSMVKPVTRGAVRSENARPGDQDGDGVADSKDLCIAEAEDRDGFEDDDGCPDPDNDKDRILDKDDKCPNESEAYNGYQDNDGCPDKGKVVVQRASLMILDKIYFGKGSAEIKAVSRPIMNAIAATLKGNPQILAIEIQGHASKVEGDLWGVSARRAGAVRAALISQGVRTGLKARAFGDTQPVGSGAGEDQQSRNRRVEFLVLKRSDGDERSEGPVTATAVQGRSGPTAAAATVAGMVRYQLPGEVSIGEGTTTMVTMIDRKITARDVQLYRPDSNVSGSRRHPQRAAMLENSGRLTLESGPVAIFARGTFVGEGLLQRLHPGEVAHIPYAVDGSTTVQVTSRGDQRPSRLISVVDGVVTVENHDERVTRYEVEAGNESPDLMVVKHSRAGSEYDPIDLPAGTRKTSASLLVPFPLRAGKRSVFTVRERRPVRKTIWLKEGGREAQRLELYLDGSSLTPKGRAGLKRVIKVQRRVAGLSEAVDRLRSRITDVGVRGGELRENLKALAKTRGAAKLKKKLLKRIADNVSRMEKLTQKLAKKTLEHGRARDTLKALIRKLRVGKKD